jgi:NADH-quinone oxidoreductase subunit N
MLTDWTGLLPLLIFAALGMALVVAGANWVIFFLGLEILSLALALIFPGIGFKLSIVPFHLWTPDVYQGAPAPVTAFMFTGSKVALFAATRRFALAAVPGTDLAIGLAGAVILAAILWLGIIPDSLLQVITSIAAALPKPV